MEISIGKLSEGKSTIIKGKEYLETSAYVQPFINAMSSFTKDFVIRVQLPSQITVTGTKEDITYNRV